MPNHMNQCCCGAITCSEWLQCPAMQITFPKMTFNRRQEERTSAGNLYENIMEFVIKDAVFARIPGDPSGCYYLQSALVDVTMTSKIWRMWDGIINVNPAVNPTANCPDCLERCLISETTFTATNHAITNCATICCVLPCGQTAIPLIKMQFECIIQGTAEECYYSSFDFGLGNCNITCDKPYGTSMYFGFDAWTPSQCVTPNIFKCRSVDWYKYDISPFNYQGGFWGSGRITGGSGGGGNPINEICSGAYQHERPLCIPIDVNIFVTDLSCIGTNIPWGVELDHYNVTSCKLTSQQQTGGIALCKTLECIDTSKVGAACCDASVKCCSCFLNCDPYFCGGGLYQCANKCCNTDGLLAYIERFDSSRSTWLQPTVP